jgi:hypothetical protein
MAATPERAIKHILLPCFCILDNICINCIGNTLRKFFCSFKHTPFGFERTFRSVCHCQKDTGLAHTPAGIGAVQTIFFSHLYDIRCPDIFTSGPFHRLLRRLSRREVLHFLPAVPGSLFPASAPDLLISGI